MIDRHLADGCQRRDPARADGGGHARDHGDADTDRKRHAGRLAAQHQRAFEVDAEGIQQAAQTQGDPAAEQDPERGRRDAGEQRLDEHGCEHLPAGRAERAQQRRLAQALCDGDREGVVDAEGRDQQGDPDEHR